MRGDVVGWKSIPPLRDVVSFYFTAASFSFQSHQKRLVVQVCQRHRMPH